MQGRGLADWARMSAPGHTALGAWSGGRFMHFGEQIDDERFVRLLRPDEAIHTVVTADVYGAGEADLAVGRALAGLPRDSFALVGAVGHDFYGTQRDGAKGFPRFTALRPPEQYGAICGTPPSAASSAAGWTRSTSSSCTTPIASATRRPSSGRRWPACARRACALPSASLPAPPTASRSTSSAAWSVSGT